MSKASANALQLVLFEAFDLEPPVVGAAKGGAAARDPQSHLIALYDLAPKYVFASRDGQSPDVSNERLGLPSVSREFSYRGTTFDLTIQPARLSRVVKDAANAGEKPVTVEYEVFPAEREQVVEQVVRRLAVDRSRLRISGENRDQVQMRFSLREIQRELRAVGRTLSIIEIREALSILARSRIIITQANAQARKGRPTHLLESTTFPVLVIRQPTSDEDGDEETHLQFNPLVAEAISRLEFKPISYRWLMRLSNPTSRWLYNYLSAEYDMAGGTDAAEARAVTLSADQIIKNSGMNVWSRLRDTLRTVTAAVDALVDEGILNSVEKVYHKSGNRIDDIEYVMVPSQQFIDQMRRSSAVQEANAATFKTITGSDDRPKGFVPLHAGQAMDVRRRRSGLLAPSDSSDTEG